MAKKTLIVLACLTIIACRFHRNHLAAELLDERPRRLDRKLDPARRMSASLRNPPP